MAVINRTDLPTITLPKRTVEVPELGGEVVVTGLMLNDRMKLLQTADDGVLNISLMLSKTVQGADKLPLMNQEQWDIFGAKYFKACMSLFKVARELSGFDVEAAEKN